MTFIEQFTAARRAGTPLVCIRTADPAATVRSVIASLNGDAPPVLHWDIIRGIQGMNTPGIAATRQLGVTPDNSLPDPVMALQAAHKLPDGAILFFANTHRIIKENGLSQAVWNLRDPFKNTGCMLVLLCPMLDTPVEIQQDIIMLDEPLPDIKQLGDIVQGVYRSAEEAIEKAVAAGKAKPLPKLTPEVLTSATDALIGLAAFPSEQVAAMSVGLKGLDIPQLWERKRMIVDDVRGLKVWRGKETFSDIRGYQNAIAYLTGIMRGKGNPRLVGWIDEAEKQFAGFGTDTSGSTGKQVGSLLTFMEDRRCLGVMLVGAPGCAKSMLAKACGLTFQRPTIKFDAAAMEGSLVGETKMYTEYALKTLDAMSEGRILFIATCNKISNLPPEFRRRFKDATFFCDLPTKPELAELWKLYSANYDIAGPRAKIPASEGWTGAEVRNCCEIAWRFDCTLEEAASYIVPVCRSGAKDIDALRQQANGTFISASYPGVYDLNRNTNSPTVEVQFQFGGRKMEIN